ncbi:MAG: cytidine deaminase [Chitinophagaceae bacterium]|nr:cytidine deaminase [Chitinophagaceae bacterium]
MKIQGAQFDLLSSDDNLTAEQKAIFAYLNALPDGGYLSPQQVQYMLSNYGLTLQKLMQILVPAATKFASPPISNFKVGAVVHGISGAIYFGANIEFMSEALSFTVHAEQASIAHAISYGEQGVDYLAISAAPCGYCRQFLYEIINTPTTPDISVLINNTSNTLSSLIPQAFGPQDLGISTRLMLPQNNNLQLSSQPTDPVVIKALQAANVSYSPYTSDFSGICIATNYGTYGGSYAENAAYNPSMSPLEAALVLLVMSGDSYGNIQRIVLVEASNNNISQKSATEDVISSIAPGVTIEYYIATN